MRSTALPAKRRRTRTRRACPFRRRVDQSDERRSASQRDPHPALRATPGSSPGGRLSPKGEGIRAGSYYIASSRAPAARDCVMDTFRRLIEAIEAEGAAALITLAETAGSSPREAGVRIVVRERRLSTARSAAASSNTRRSTKRARRSPPGAGRRAAARSRWGRSSASVAAGASSGGSRPSTRAISPPLRRSAPPSAKARSSRWRGSAPTAASSAGLARVGRGRRLARSVRRGDDAGLSLRRRPCRPRAGAGAGAAALRGALDRPAPRRVPQARARQRDAGRRRRSARRTGRGADGAFVLAITHSHALDLAVVAEALRQDRFPYVGVIGSATKRARFASQFKAAGFAEAASPGSSARSACRGSWARSRR